MRQYRKHGAGWTHFRTLADWLSNREPFRNSSGTFKGEDNPYVANVGWLNNYPEDADMLRKAHANGKIDYVVWSYATPLAWHHTDEGWINPGHSYSRTSAQHYNVLADALSELGD